MNYEGAIHYDQGNQHAGSTFYYNRIRDLIAVDPSFTTVINVNEARIRGATLFYSVDREGYRAKAEITREDATDVATHNQLVRRAKAFGTLSRQKCRARGVLGENLSAAVRVSTALQIRLLRAWLATHCSIYMARMR